jgi:hypothetical protein
VDKLCKTPNAEFGEKDWCLKAMLASILQLKKIVTLQKVGNHDKNNYNRDEGWLKRKAQISHE